MFCKGHIFGLPTSAVPVSQPDSFILFANLATRLCYFDVVMMLPFAVGTVCMCCFAHAAELDKRNVTG
jgi:hypothetical protein